MTKLKLGPLSDDKSVKLTVEIPAELHRSLVDYGRLLAAPGDPPIEPMRLIVPMLERFIVTDRGFAKARRSGRVSQAQAGGPSPSRD